MHKRFTRRIALKMGLVGAFLAACRVTPRPAFPPTIPPKPRYGLMSEHDTSRGKLFPLIESWPDIRTKEMAWIKQHNAGKIISVALERGKGYVERGGEFLPVRSRMHTHTIKSNTITDRKLASLPSIVDIHLLIAEALKNMVHPEKMVRVSHVIPISYEGKVAGFISCRIGKKMVNAIETDFKKAISESDPSKFGARIKGVRDFLSALKHTEELKEKYKDGVEDFDSFIIEYQDLLSQLKSAGFQLRITARPGYEFKDGYFQSKT